MHSTVSVVIPTMGRPVLLRALRSVQDQTAQPAQIIVVDDGEAPMPVQPVLPGLDVLLLRTGGRAGAAAARNVGLRAATGTYVAFLDDDDVWLDDHLASARALLDRRSDVDIYAGSALVRYQGYDRLEPTVLHDGDGTLLDHYYGRTVWARRRRRVVTPALVFRRSVAALDMDESLDVLEDIWWLLSAEARGHRLLQTGKVAVLVHQDADREAARDSMQANLRWAQRLDSLKAGSGSNYLVGTVGRQLARTGRLREFRQLTEHLRTSSLPLDLRTVLLLEGLLARIESRRR